MGGKFCTQCGNRLSGAGRFCANCGAPIEGGSPDRSIQERSPGSILADSAEQEPIGISTADLNTILGCSLMNAPLNTDFLLVQNTKEDWAKWIPLVFIESMQNLKPLAAASVYYFFSDRSPSYPNECWSWMPEEVSDAYMDCRDLHIVVRIQVHFKPVDYGKLDTMRGRWVTLVDDKKFYRVGTVTPLHLSGWAMKRVLREHEEFIKKALEAFPDDEYARDMLGTVQTIIQEMPDGFADNMFSLVFTLLNDKTMTGVVLTDEDYDAGKVALRSLKNLNALRSGKPPMLRQDISRTALARRTIGVPSVSKTVASAAPGAQKKARR